MGRIATRRHRAALFLAAQQLAEQQEPERRSQDVRGGARGGRPRLGDQEWFQRRFAAVLRRLSDGTMSQREATREVGTVGRYLEREMGRG